MAEEVQESPATPGGDGGANALIAGQRVGMGRYTLQSQLGQGGMGMVWLAKDEQLGENVALKFLLREISHDADALEDMRRETLKSRRLSHPNIIRIHDLHQAPGEAPFISMEFIQGTPLSALKARQPHRLFPWAFLQPLVKQLCDALDYAHRQKVIHRDLKPANMMLNSEGELKLADFGIAATASDSLSRLTRNLGSSGTPAYMSPQQMNSQAPKVTDDIYALGATLYELLTSKPPFYSGDIYRQVKEEPATPPDQRLADLELSNEIPPDVATLIMACLAKDPGHRPQSAGAVAEWIGLNLGRPLTSALVSEPAAPLPPVPGTDSAAPEPQRTANPDRVANARGAKGWLWATVSIAILICVGAWWRSCTTERRAQVTPSTPAKAPKSHHGNGQETVFRTTVPPPPSDANGFSTLFNGRDLTGWKSGTSQSAWFATNGILTCITNKKLGTQDLFSDDPYGDVAVEVEARWGDWQNVGITLRGSRLKFYLGNPLNLTPTESCSAWDTDKRRFIARAQGVETLLKRRDWNTVRVEALGSRFQVWLNGGRVLDFTNADYEGVAPIRLTFRPETDRNKVEFRSIKVKRLK